MFGLVDPIQMHQSNTRGPAHRRREDGSMNQQLIPACQMFLLAASILFVALAVARTEALKTLISLMGCGVGLIWFARIYRWAGGLSFGDKFTALGLAIIFLV